MLAAPKQILIGTRGSKLAVTQAQEVKDQIIEAHPSYATSPDSISIITFKTTGDRITNKSLVEIGGKGLFIKEIEEALIAKKVDIAVHSMKDMPAFFDDRLEILSIPARKDAKDALISLKYNSISDLPSGATIGTSSPRRAAIITNKRPDVKIINFRGNIDTRIKKLKEGQVDAIVLSVAGLKRIGLEREIKQIIDIKEMLPAVGQGALALQGRKDDQFITDILQKINHQESAICVDAERSFLKNINGSCNTPMAAFCQIIDGKLHLRTELLSPDGADIYQIIKIGNLDEAVKIGREAAQQTKENANHILQKIAAAI
jgi:hydroxymethylbilane synthase